MLLDAIILTGNNYITGTGQNLTALLDSFFNFRPLLFEEIPYFILRLGRFSPLFPLQSALLLSFL